jgi:type VI secretion system protein ImpL
MPRRPRRPHNPLRGKLRYLTAPGLLVYMALTYLISNVLHLSGWRLWAFRVVLWLLGVVAFALIYSFMKRSSEAKAEEEQATADDELDTLLATAKTRLLESPSTETALLAKLPMVMVLGPESSAKTSSIVGSGLGPELLAGAAHHGDRVAPTGCINLWYAHNTVFLETGGGFGDDPARWRKLIRAIRPQTLSAVFTGRSQAPRVAVVCMSCEELLRPDASTSIAAVAQELRTTLVDLAHGFGTQLPVYVLFTKADRIPYFAEYVANLTREESQEVMGTTLRWPANGMTPEKEYARINDGFQRLFAALAEQRLRFLSREPTDERKAAAYEFPREFRKIAPLATQFLVDLCRPSQLRISPVLRGFYLSGVRAVVVSDAAPEPAPRPAIEPQSGRSATQVFDASRLSGTQSADPAAATSRRLPQWLFLGRLFRDVILRDRMAMGVTQTGAHMTLRRRLLMSGAVAASMMLGTCFTTSYFGNKALERRAMNAAAGLVDVRSREPELPAIESLDRLETLREEISVLAHYERDGVPFRLRWGLYKGDDLLGLVRSLYLERVDHLLLRPARERMADSLRTLPAAPDSESDFENTYTLLKAYLMTTIETGRIDSTFLAPILWEKWLGRRPIDDERTALVRDQFDFYSGALCYGDDTPCAAEADSRAVVRACTYLRGFSGAERYYQMLLSKASTGIPAIRLRQVFPGSAGIVDDAYAVPGAFTPDGWAAVHADLRSMDELAEAEAWVCEETTEPVDRTALASTLLDRYTQDYVRHWRNFLSNARVASFRSTREASDKLGALAGNQSPLLQALALVAQNTVVDSALVDSAFQPVHVVTPPEITDRFVSENNQSYVNSLIALHGLVEQARDLGAGGEPRIVSETRAAARAADGEVQRLAQQFRVDGAARDVGAEVQALLKQPVDNVERLLLRLPAARLNAEGAAFCNDIGPLLNKYPFNPGATTQATLDEVSAVFQPGSGRLWRFYDELLADKLVEQGTIYGVAPGATMRPRQSYIDFFNAAARLSRTLWSESTRDAGFTFTVKPTLSSAIPDMRITVDGRPYSFTRTRIRTEVIRWAGAGAQEAVIAAEIRGREQDLLRYDGLWALFKLFGDAEWQRAGQKYNVRWVFNPQDEQVTLDAEVDLGGKPPLLQRGAFASVRNCVGRIVP